MHDWMFEPGLNPLPLTVPEQPWSPEQGATHRFPPDPADDLETWLFEPQPKGDLGDFGPMFLDGEGGPPPLCARFTGYNASISNLGLQYVADHSFLRD